MTIAELTETTPAYNGAPIYRVGDTVTRAGYGGNGWPEGVVTEITGAYEVRVLWNGRKSSVFATGLIKPR